MQPSALHVEPDPQDDATDSAPWSPRDTLIGTLLTLVPLVLLSLSNQAGGTPQRALSVPADTFSAIVSFVLVTVLEGVFVIAPLYYTSRRVGGAGWRSLGFRAVSPYVVLALVVGGMVLVYISGALIDVITQNVFHQSLQTNFDQLVNELHVAPRTVVASTLVAVLFAPIFEEMFFRGFLLQGLRAVVSTPWAVVLSALIFAAVHVSPGSFPLLFILGLLLGAMRVMTRSLWPGIALHMLNNAIGFIQILIILKK